MGNVTTTTDKSDIIDFLQDRLDNYPDKASETLGNILNIYASVEEVLSPVRTGQNRDETKVEWDGLQGDAWPDAPQAKFIIEGTEPHIILPVNAKALWWPGALHPYKVVHHPGTAANDYVAEAVDEADPGVDREIDELGDWSVGD